MHIKLLLVLLKNLRRKEKELREIHKSASGAVTGAVLFKIRGAKVGSGNLAGEQGKRKEREREREREEEAQQKAARLIMILL